MITILASLVLFFSGNLPEGYQFQNHKIFREKPVSASGCADVGVMRIQGEAYADYVLSYCRKESDPDGIPYRVFRIQDGKQFTITDFSRYLSQTTGQNSLSYDDKRMYLYGTSPDSSQNVMFIIQEEKAFPIEYASVSRNGVGTIFSHKSVFFFLEPGEGARGNLRRLEFPDQDVRSIPWKSFTYLSHYSLLVFESMRSSDQYGLYSLSTDKWILFPFSNACERFSGRSERVFLDLTYPVASLKNEKHIYFKIYINGDFHSQTGYFMEGEEAGVFIAVNNGNHVVKVEKYLAQITQGGEKKYVAAKNIEQLYPLKIKIADNNRYRIHLQKDTSGEKPFLLQSVQCE